jgi:lysophospholipase L1-like esterase
MAEPIVVTGGTAISEAWYPAFSEYQQAVRKIANEINATFIPLQAVFDEALKVAPVSYWCPDGVHPSIAGSYLMKQVWMEALEKL